MSRAGIAAPVIKSLIFVLVTVLSTLVLAVSVGSSGVGEAHTYRAVFTDTTGLADGDSVRIAGVQVGEVTGIKVVDRRYAEVSFTVEKGREIPASTTAAIRYLNMVGQRYISLGQGAGEVGDSLGPDEVIPLERTAPALDLTQLFNGFQPLFRGLDPDETNQLAVEIVQVLQGEGGTVTSLLSHVGSLTTTLAAEDEVIGEVIDNLNTVLDTVNEREEEFTELVSTTQELVSGFAADREPLGDAIQAMGDLSVSTAGLLEDGREPLRQDIAELGRLSGNLAENTPLLENFLQNTPEKMESIARLASYGSWFNAYLCEATVTGVSTWDGSRAPTGLPITESRCRS
ncbi:MCE family protein [Streptomyces sp. NBC_01803]|uniref:MCE family protein n=1 Tax=Streptomyces sp. NBC_01803 TaxID=2975946 RepID=UPI002DD80344|nr:MCE family protein [Streptomyces sp. NBC_01803]WSA43564.1 MCE family protein [Streptomyces sp. NBC_01803]